MRVAIPKESADTKRDNQKRLAPDCGYPQGVINRWLYAASFLHNCLTDESKRNLFPGQAPLSIGRGRPRACPREMMHG